MLSRLALGRAVHMRALLNSANVANTVALASPRALHLTPKAHLPIVLPEESGKVRHGLIPEEFFQMFYKKTGVTGPYMFLTGLTTYMISQEIYVINDETVVALTVFGIFIVGVKKFGQKFAAMLDKMNEDTLTTLYAVKENRKDNVKVDVNAEELEQWRADGHTYLYDAKRENASMLVENNYRERLLEVNRAVKNRLDYHLAVQNSERLFAQNHMVEWIESQVIKGITPQQEKENIVKCINDLKSLAAAK